MHKRNDRLYHEMDGIKAGKCKMCVKAMKKNVLREPKGFGMNIMKRMMFLGEVCSPRLVSQ